MMASSVPVRKTISFLGVLSMSLDWVPGAGIAIAGSLLGLWRNNAVLEEKVGAVRKRVEDFEHSQELLEGSVHGQIANLMERLNGAVTTLQVMAEKQAGASQMAALTMEGIMRRVEAMEARQRSNEQDINRHDKDIALTNAWMRAQG